ncbi:MAG: glycosyltransferase [Pseudomonadota bacterium]
MTETKAKCEETATPRVSIGLPVYNGENYLAEAIDSILSQTFTDFELIISDNASTDGTQAICERYAAADKRVRYSRLAENLGAAPNYNRLVEMARGEYFHWHAHDDVLELEFVARCVETLDSQPDVVLVYPATHVIDGNGEVMSLYRDDLDLPQNSAHERLVAYLRQNFMRKRGLCNPIFGMIRTASLRETRLIQDFLSSDRLLLAHFALLGKFIELPEPLFKRRVHAGISTMADRRLKARRAWFNTRATESNSWLPSALTDNLLALRLKHFGDLYRAIQELVADPAERRCCQMALTKLIVTDPKWIYIDLKYSLGFQPSNKQQMQQLRTS